MDADDAIARAEIARKYVREAIEQSKRLRDSVEGRQFPPVEPRAEPPQATETLDASVITSRPAAP